MRIIGGSCRGRRLLAPGRRFAARVRPTSDRAREGLFNILAAWEAGVEGARVLELFAGTGALGLEALSRGAASALFVEQDGAVAELLERNLELCGFAAPVARVWRRDCSGGLGFLAAAVPPSGFSLVLADPPYALGLAEPLLQRLAAALAVPQSLLAPDALVVVETGRGESLPTLVGSLGLAREPRRYGEALFHFYQSRQETEVSDEP